MPSLRILTFIRAQHNATSLLLKMPQEIKNHIFFLVCGGHVLHIHDMHTYPASWTNKDTSNTICGQDMSDDDAQAIFDTAPDSRSSYRESSCRHNECRSRSNAEPLKLSWLRTCCQLYDAGKCIPYEANAFAFSDAEVFTRFMRLSRLLLSHIRTLKLYMATHQKKDLQAWADNIWEIPQSCPNLQSINLDHFQDYWYNVKTAAFKTPDQLEEARASRRRNTSHDDFYLAIMDLRVLPLKKVTSIIMDHSGDWVWKYTWSDDERKFWSRHIRETLLEPFEG